MKLTMEPTSVIAINLGIAPSGEVQKFFTETCAKAMDDFVPFKKGNLADYIIVGTEIWYDQEYAEYQYNGMRKDGTHKIVNRTTSYHPLATSNWDKVMWTAKGSDIVKQVQDKIKKGS